MNQWIFDYCPYLLHLCLVPTKFHSTSEPTATGRHPIVAHEATQATPERSKMANRHRCQLGTSASLRLRTPIPSRACFVSLQVFLNVRTSTASAHNHQPLILPYQLFHTPVTRPYAEVERPARCTADASASSRAPLSSPSGSADSFASSAGDYYSECTTRTPR